VAFAPGGDLTPILLLSRLAVHTENLDRDARASLLLTAPPRDGETAMATIRLTLVGTAEPDPDPALRRAYLARHPDSAAYAGFADFRIFRFSIAKAHLVAGFGLIETIQASALTGGSPDFA
jgi:putative heme iron utilization protein